MTRNCRVSDVESWVSVNPVRGCLFIGKDTPNNHLLLVFRRRELRETAELPIVCRVFRRIEIASATPPKNKKTKGRVGNRCYKQATPNGVYHRISRPVQPSPTQSNPVQPPRPPAA